MNDHCIRNVWMILVMFFLVQEGSSKPYVGGHSKDYHAIVGKEYARLCKYVSTKIDGRDLYDAISQHCKIKYHNHRIVGHWGFSGAIPLNKEPYKTAFSEIPREKVVTLWQQHVRSMIQEGMLQTGYKFRQAQGLVGIIYDIHLLGDLVPGNVITDPLPSPESICKDLLKNLRRLLGNNSNFVKELASELKQINHPNDQLVANEMLLVLSKSMIREKLDLR